MGSENSQVLTHDQQGIRTIVLNRPKQLNALSYYMVSRLLDLFLEYEEDPGVKMILLKGSGRAFCAGGDVAAVALDLKKGDWISGANYFGKEFTLNYIIATYRKPQVSLLNGIVMGGGAGASIHGRFRVVTENTVFAMPETALGLFPDVGASYFLSRLPGFFGEYVGLTGTRLDGPELLACGLATHYVRSTKLPSLEQELFEANSGDPIHIAKIIDKYAEQPFVKEQSAYRGLHIIEKCFSCRTVEEILSAVENEAGKRSDDWVTAALQSLKKASPMSLKISLVSIRKGRLQGIGECLMREYRMVCNVLRGEVSKDLIEGCRALLIEKDKNPKWEPSRLELVTDDMKLPSLEQELFEANSGDPIRIAKIIDRYAEQPSVKEQSAYRGLHIIEKCFSCRTAEEILSAVENEAGKRSDDWATAALQSLKKASPTSLKISLESIRKGRLQGIGECLRREYRMVCHVLRGEVSKDLIEGCRALLIEKDKNPKWEPSRLDLVTDDMVSHYWSQ